MSQSVNLIEELSNVLGHNPTKEPGITKDAFAEILTELQAERKEKAKVKARETVVKAVELAKQMSKARREFEKIEAGFNKELTQLLGQLRSAVNGQPAKEESSTPDAQT